MDHKLHRQEKRGSIEGFLQALRTQNPDLSPTSERYNQFQGLKRKITTLEEVFSEEDNFSEPTSAQKPGTKKPRLVTMFLSGIDPSLTDKQIKAVLSSISQIRSFRRPEKPRAGANSKSYAFFEVESQYSANYTDRPVLVRGFLLNCKVAKDKSKLTDEADKKLYVSNLPPNMTDLELFNLFSPYGRIKKAFMVKNKNDGSPKSFGFVLFNDVADLHKLLDSHQKGIDFKNRTIWLKLATLKNDGEETSSSSQGSVKASKNFSKESNLKIEKVATASSFRGNPLFQKLIKKGKVELPIFAEGDPTRYSFRGPCSDSPTTQLKGVPHPFGSLLFKKVPCSKL